MNRTALALISFPILVIGVFVLWQMIHSSEARARYVLTPLPETTTKQSGASTTTEEKLKPIMSEIEIPSGPIQNHPIPLATYLEITTGCSLVQDETCAKAYSRPNSDSTIRYKLRIGSVLKVKNTITGTDGNTWYEIEFPEPIRYPERLSLPWFVQHTAGVPIKTHETSEVIEHSTTSEKRIIVDRSDQKLFAYDKDTLVYTYTISTGRELTPTPRGIFKVFKKTPSRYMQGPIPGISNNYYDLPGVPWNLYFTEQGAVIHGAYWHDDFGHQHSNGCVNLRPEEARVIYDWAELGTTVLVRD